MTVDKDFGAPADGLPGGQTVTVDTTQTSLQGSPTVHVQHDPTDHEPVPFRRLACTKCGHGFTVHEGEQALARKRRREVGLTDEPDTHKAFIENAADTFGKVRPW